MRSDHPYDPMTIENAVELTGAFCIADLFRVVEVDFIRDFLTQFCKFCVVGRINLAFLRLPSSLSWYSGFQSAPRVRRQLKRAPRSRKMSVIHDADDVYKEIDRVAVRTGHALAKSYAVNFCDKFEVITSEQKRVAEYIFLHAAADVSPLGPDCAFSCKSERAFGSRKMRVVDPHEMIKNGT